MERVSAKASISPEVGSAIGARLVVSGELYSLGGCVLFHLLQKSRDLNSTADSDRGQAEPVLSDLSAADCVSVVWALPASGPRAAYADIVACLLKAAGRYRHSVNF